MATTVLYNRAIPPLVVVVTSVIYSSWEHHTIQIRMDSGQCGKY